MEFDEALKLLKILSDENRLRIVMLLTEEKETCACRLLEGIRCGQPTLSHHMKLLVRGGLVTAREEGKWTYYSLNKAVLHDLTSFFRWRKEK